MNALKKNSVRLIFFKHQQKNKEFFWGSNILAHQGRCKGASIYNTCTLHQSQMPMNKGLVF
jgi:hypothetical protein